MRVPGLEIHLTAEDVPWRPTRVEGVSWYLLATEEGEEGGGGDGAGSQAPGPATGATVLIRMAPGRGYPPHRHLDVEEVLVLQGGYRDGRGTHRAGTYLRYAAGTRHAPVALGEAGAPPGPANPACILFATARGGIEILAQDDDPSEPPPIGS